MQGVERPTSIGSVRLASNVAQPCKIESENCILRRRSLPDTKLS